jgi:hypothetical protein
VALRFLTHVYSYKILHKYQGGKSGLSDCGIVRIVWIVRIPDTNVLLTVPIGPQLLYFGSTLGSLTAIFWRHP